VAIEDLLERLRALKNRLGWMSPLRRRVGERAGEQAVCAAARADRYDVVCLAICDWDQRFQRPQQLMARFAAAGHRVFFVRPRFGRAYALRLKRENVYEVTVPSPSLDALRNDCGIGEAAIIVQLPFWWPLAREARERFAWPVVYDCMDLHAGFANVRRAEVAHEAALLAAADVVTVSSAMLERRAREHRDDVVMVRNGCDYEHFAATEARRNVRPVIGFYGAISDWFEDSLVAELAKRRPDWDFVLVGSTWGGRVAKLRRLANVSLPGEQPYAALPEWLGGFDVAIIPFRRLPLTEATNPVKVYEMLASGKPVVSVPLPEVVPLAPLVRLASSAAEFERQIEAALAEDPGAAEARRAFAREQTWERRFEVLAAAITNRFRRATTTRRAP
jgi:glycosyltransferase involved in cell wall biosynthesis